MIATHLFSNPANMPSRSSSTANKPISAGEIFTNTELSYKHYTFVLGHVQHESSRRIATAPPTWLPPRRRTALLNQMRKTFRTATPNLRTLMVPKTRSSKTSSVVTTQSYASARSLSTRRMPEIFESAATIRSRHSCTIPPEPHECQPFNSCGRGRKQFLVQRRIMRPSTGISPYSHGSFPKLRSRARGRRRGC